MLGNDAWGHAIVSGDGAASPHTKSDLNYIQKLKAKHGIDYDSHASYRFVEE